MAVNHHNIKNWVPSILTHNLWLIFIEMKQKKNTKKAVLALFRAYFKQPQGHIGWVTLMSLESINPNIPRTNLWNFGEKKIELKISVFLSRPFWLFFKKKNFFFASFPWKLVNIYNVARMGRNFDDYPGFQPQTAPA